jgi:hypothetical protein
VLEVERAVARQTYVIAKYNVTKASPRFSENLIWQNKNKTEISGYRMGMTNVMNTLHLMGSQLSLVKSAH